MRSAWLFPGGPLRFHPHVRQAASQRADRNLDSSGIVVTVWSLRAELAVSRTAR